jgi:hypothetical protein
VWVGCLALFLIRWGCLGVHCRICYLQGCRRVSDGWLSCVDLACMWGVFVWLVVWQRISMIAGLAFRTERVLWCWYEGWFDDDDCDA